ncbi:hypothetical protein AMTR_s00024p00228650 [Amborella trichopoda]|uniref:Uncharacterized protein n=1 Tax=Amborella trichopoda TaxID=13333 RepID=W1PT72_AMBTC|nr:hypothetical protein AMTR_s00024p00228650 [Amborella trichopoda]
MVCIDNSTFWLEKGGTQCYQHTSGFNLWPRKLLLLAVLSWKAQECRRGCKRPWNTVLAIEAKYGLPMKSSKSPSSGSVGNSHLTNRLSTEAGVTYPSSAHLQEANMM